MRKDDVVLIGNKQGKVEEKVELQPLSKVIKSLKDRCYAVTRYAYLKNWNYFIVETKEFRLSVKPSVDPIFFSYLQLHSKTTEAIWICIDGMNFYPIMAKSKLEWASADSDKSSQCWVEGDVFDRPLPSKDDLMDDFRF